MRGQIPSSPRFFRLIKRALLVALPVLLLGALFIHAPLETLADPAHPPNPAKSAWFLLWIQELVSHGTIWISLVVVLAGVFVCLPWLRPRGAERAAWFQRGERLVGTIVLALLLGIVILTLVAMFLRGPNWQLVGW